jgi:hypothetical protein
MVVGKRGAWMSEEQAPAENPENNLEPRWQRFCRRFVELGGNIGHPNGQRCAAARYAGYKSPDTQATYLLKQDKCKEFIAKLIEVNTNTPDYSAPLVTELVKRLDHESTTAKNDMARIKALETLCKWRGMLIDRHVVEQPMQLTVYDDSGKVLEEIKPVEETPDQVPCEAG